MLIKQGDRQKASEHYSKQLSLAENMLASDPTNAQFISNHAVALIKAGDIEVRDRRPANAISKYEQALRIRERLAAAAPQDIFIRQGLAEVWIKRGDAMQRAGARVQAMEYYRKSLVLLEALSSSMPAHAGIRGMLATAYSRVGHVNFALASQVSSPRSNRIDHLHAARSAFKRALDISIDMRDRGIVNPTPLDVVADGPERLTAEIAKCDAALKTAEL